MSLSDQYRRRIQQARDKIASLQKEKSRHTTKAAGLQKKINSATEAANRTTSSSTLKSKLREAERASKELASVEGKIASVESKIAAEYKKISGAEQSLAREDSRDAKKRQREADRVVRETRQRMAGIDGKLAEHDMRHEEVMSEIEKLKLLPEKIKVLFLAANPLDQVQLRLDEEVRSVTDMIRKSKHRDSVELVSCWAIRPPDVLQGLNEHQPAIVHFSGHGSDQDEIVFQDDQGNTKLVSKEAIVQTMMACSGSIRLVFFNTCYSHNQAEAVVEHVDAAIGMNTSIADDAACIFASQFYSAIGFGLSVQTAFDQARALVMMEGISEEDTPELFVADGLSADTLVIVQPAEPDSGAEE